MAYAAQYLEGLQALFETMHVHVGTPALYCDNRAAVHLTSSAGEWRTKALANRVLGVRSLTELAITVVRFRPTLEMEADCLTKFMGAKIIKRQRGMIGCVPLHNAR